MRVTTAEQDDSAFNTIRPALLTAMQVIVNYPTGRPQYVRLQGCVWDAEVSKMGATQGTVLSPFPFTLYTSDSRYNSGRNHSAA